MKVLTIASNFPDRYYKTITPWSKKQVDSIKKYSNIKIEVLVPRPYILPFKFFPYNKFSKLPLKEISELNYTIHYPRFPYLLPKNIFFSITGDLFRYIIYHYTISNIKRSDIIHARFPFLDGYGAYKICNKWKNNLVVDIHGNYDFSRNVLPLFVQRKNQNILNYSTKILCVAKWQIKKGLQIGIAEEKLEYVPLGIDIDKFKIMDNERIREEFQIKEEIIILFVGQLIKRKSVDILIKSLTRIDKKLLKKCKIIIIGDGSEKMNLIKMVHDLDLKNKVKFLGLVSDENLKKWYSIANIFVLPSISEGKPTVINEAMASECAIIASNVSGIPEQIIEDYNGFLIEPKDIKTLSNKIAFLIDDRDLLEYMGKNSKRLILKKNLTWEGYAKKVERIYKQIIDKQ